MSIFEWAFERERKAEAKLVEAGRQDTDTRGEATARVASPCTSICGPFCIAGQERKP